MVDQCDMCKHGYSGWTVVGERHSDGYEDFDCEKWDVMTDEDTELCNQGKCPYFEKKDPYAEDIYSEDMEDA